MKQLELELNKRLLIVELEVDVIGAFIDEYSLCIKVEGDDKFWHSDYVEIKKASAICRGSDLTEEISDYISIKIPGCKMTYFKDGDDRSNITASALESFISAIESQGYYWGENPIKLIERGEDTERNRVLNQDQWREAESKTFNPEKTLIFEIL